MGGIAGAIGSALADAGGGFLGALGGEALGPALDLSTTVGADIGGALGGAAAGALVSPKHRALGALGGGLEGAFVGPGLTNLTDLSTAITGGHVIPLADSLFGGRGFGNAPSTIGRSTPLPGSPEVNNLPFNGAPGNENAMTGTITEGLPPSEVTAARNAIYSGGSLGGPGAFDLLTGLVSGGAQSLGVFQGGPRGDRGFSSPAPTGFMTGGSQGKSQGFGGPQVGSTAPAAASLAPAAAAAVPAAAGLAGAPAAAAAAPAAAGLLGGSGGLFGSGITIPDLLSALGLGAAVIKGNQPPPNLGNLQGLAEQAAGNAFMASDLQKGNLPPGAEQYVDTSLNDAEAGIKSRYASLGLSGSTMEAQDIAGAQERAEGMKFQIAQQTTQTGLASMQLADTIYQQIADFQLGQDQELQNALAQFAAAANGGAPGTGLGPQFGTAA